MANYVLMHGAWHWGACFQKLAAELLAAGHNVAMPDLATHGFDTTPPGTVADMAQYTAPARRMIEASSEPVILLGHSMGGASVTYLGEQMPEKIKALVYLTAFMVPNGKTPNEYITAERIATNPRTAELLQILQPTATGLAMDASNRALVKAAFYGDCSDHDISVALANNIPVQSFIPVITPSETTAARFGKVRRVYIECTEDKAIAIETQRMMQADVPGAEVLTMHTSHSPFFSQPQALGSLLAGLA
ncbi:MAG: alpha/beta fold hydrolase [Acidocella sp.]|nr:alpha/beta fold hydrolase [Acidocella sp.]